jgi:hypothetical protein
MPQPSNPRSSAQEPAVRKAESKPEPTALDQAFNALRTYGEGSSRAALLPIDEAVVTCLEDGAARKPLERKLVAALKAGGSAVAREYLCSKLALVGTESCTPSLAALLADPPLATAARNALEAIPHSAAARALRDSLPKLDGSQKVGVVNSLGARRDAGSVRALSRLLRKADPQLAGAAAAALGDIGSTKAAKALRLFAPQAPEAVRPRLADAMLVCAERLRESGRNLEARAICQMLDTPAQPRHVRQAAARALRQASASD